MQFVCPACGTDYVSEVALRGRVFCRVCGEIFELGPALKMEKNYCHASPESVTSCDARQLAMCEDPIRDIAFSGDGRRAVVVTGRGDLSLWDVEAQKLISGWRTGTEQAGGVALSDARILLCSVPDKEIVVWDTESLEIAGILQGHTQAVEAVAVSDKGHIAVSGGWDRTLRVWRMRDLKCAQVLKGHDAAVYRVALTTDASLAFSASLDRTVRVWDLAGGDCVRVLRGHDGPVYGVAVSVDGSLAVSASLDKTIRAWEVASGRCLNTLQGHEKGVPVVSLATDGIIAVSAGIDGSLRLWNILSGHCYKTMSEHKSAVLAAALSPDGRKAVSGSRDGVVLLWDLEWRWQAQDFQRERLLPFLRSYIAAGHDIGDEKKLAGLVMTLRHAGFGWIEAEMLEAEWQNLRGCRRSLLVVKRERRGKLRQATPIFSLAKTAEPLTGVYLDPDGGRFLLAEGGNFTLWDSVKRKKLRQFWLQACGKAVLTTDDAILFAGKTGFLKLWRGNPAECVSAMFGHIDAVNDLAVAGNGRFAISAGADCSLRIWDVAAGKCLQSLWGHRRQVLSVDISHDARMAVSGDAKGLVMLWDLQAGTNLHILEGHQGEVRAVALGSMGNVAVSAGADHSLFVWDTGTGRCLHELTGHTAPVNAVSCDEEGKIALSAGADRTLRLWDLENGRQAHCVKGHDLEITGAALSSDGGTAVSLTSQELKLWRLEWDSEFTLQAADARRHDAAADARRHDAKVGIPDLLIQQTARLQKEFRNYTDKIKQALQQRDKKGAAKIFAKLQKVPRFSLLQTYDVARQCLWPVAKRGKLMRATLRSVIHHSLQGETSETKGIDREGQVHSWQGTRLISVQYVCLTPDGRFAVYADRVWELATGRQLCALRGKGISIIDATCITADGHFVAAGSRDNAVRLWDTRTGECVRVFQGHTDSVNSVLISQDGHLVISASRDNTICIFKREGGPPRILSGHQHSVCGVLGLCMIDRDLLASAGADGTVMVWSIREGRCLKILRDRDQVWGVATTPDGKIISASNNTVHVWDLSSNRSLAVLRGHTDSVKSVSVTGDGKIAATASWDRSVRLWDLQKMTCIRVLDGHEYWVLDTAITEDGSTLLSASFENAIYVWDLHWQWKF